MAGKRILSKNTKSKSTAGSSAPQLASQLSPVIHDRIRLAILAALATGESLTFNELKEITDTSDGNLLTHARKLEAAGFITVIKSGGGRGSRTDYSLSDDGRAQLAEYLKDMEQLLTRVKKKK